MTAPIELLKNRFEKIVINCVNLSINNNVYYKSLYTFLKSLDLELIPMILNEYYIDIFAPADREFGRILLDHDLHTTCDYISHEIIIRRTRDKLFGQYN